MRVARTGWCPENPRGWRDIPLKRLCRIETGTADTQDAVPNGAYDFIVRSKNLLKGDHYTFDCEAIVTAGDGAVGEVFHYIRGKFLAHQRTYVLHSFEGIDGRFLYYYFSSLFRHMCQDGSAKTTVDSVRRWMVDEMPVLIPSADLQERIVRFLDEETAKIDHLIEKQEALNVAAQLRLMEWRERAFWGDRLVDPFQFPPPHWSRVTNRRIFAHVDSRSDSGEEEMLSVSHITGVTPRSMKTVNMFEAESTVGYKLVEPGQLVINTMWAWMGALGVSSYSGIVSPAYDVYSFQPDADINADFIDAAYRTRTYVALMKANSRGIWESRLRLYPEVFLRLPALIPPRDIQDRLVDENRERTQSVDELVNKGQRLVELLRERRSALVTAAVTGQIEI